MTGNSKRVYSRIELLAEKLLIGISNVPGYQNGSQMVLINIMLQI
jgi:hypothetical protein